MSYQMYRNTSIGDALQKTLDDYIQANLIPPQLALKVLTTFDRVINKTLQYRAKTKTTFKADKLVTYRFCDNVWTFVMEGVEFRDANRSIDGVVDRVKFVACDGRSSVPLPGSSSSHT